MKSFSYKLATTGRQGLPLIAFLLTAFVLTGCGDKGKSNQVAVKINSEEITVTQVNAALANMPVMPGKTIEDAKKEVIETLVIQNLADQQAVKMKLDRTPAVMQAIETAKNTILARAYMDPIMAGIPKPTLDEVHKFYVEHPELFANRHIFTIKELEVETKPDLAASIREMAGKGDSMDTIAAMLKSKGMVPAIETGVKPSEQLPLEMLPKFEKLGAGKLMVIEMSKSISVLQVLNAKAEPVQENVAAATIQEYLMNSRKKEVLEKEIKALKASAKIEYVGEQGTKPAVAAVSEKPVTGAPDVAKGVAGIK
jgi:EpsD family peptidyl-prolyl cis-trans isomerase